MTVKTTFANGVSPFEKPPELFTLDNPPDKSVKAKTGRSKFDYIFNQMERGQGIKCTPDDVNRVANALKHWIINHNKGGKSIQVKRDASAADTPTPSRVWWV